MASRGRAFAGTVDASGAPNDVLNEIARVANGLADFDSARITSRSLVVTRRYYSTWRFVVAVIFWPVGLLAFLAKDADVVNVEVEPHGSGGSRIRFNGITTDELSRRLQALLVDELRIESSTRVCAEGHPVRGEDRFCPRCGQQVSQDVRVQS